MSQKLIQKQSENNSRFLSKAQDIVKTKRIFRNPNSIWCIQSSNVKTPNKFYVVRFDEDLDCFTYDCKALDFCGPERCKHVLAAWFHTGGMSD
jgi:hypothetical protein